MSGYREAPDDRSGLVTAALARTLEPLGFRAKAVGESLEFVRYAFGSLTSDGTDVVPIKGAWVHPGLDLQRRGGARRGAG
jgi:hypothetical protein